MKTYNNSTLINSKQSNPNSININSIQISNTRNQTDINRIEGEDNLDKNIENTILAYTADTASVVADMIADIMYNDNNMDNKNSSNHNGKKFHINISDYGSTTNTKITQVNNQSITDSDHKNCTNVPNTV
jgi:hypothetical protein